MILPLDSAQLTRPIAGSRGHNLARLAREYLPVPPGFLVGVQAYHLFVDANHLTARISKKLNKIAAGERKALQKATDQMQAWFLAGLIPPELAIALRGAYSKIGRPPVSVHPSPTIEDPPGISLSDVHDSALLNVNSEDDLLQAIIQCWSRLWTADAIESRGRFNISSHDLGMAVVVQEMIDSEVSGILYTANPVTGARTQMMVRAIWGLGQTLTIEENAPDRYIIEKAGRRLTGIEIGAKSFSLRMLPEGGVFSQFEDATAPRQALPEDQIIHLAGLGERLAAIEDLPQEVEWAFYKGKFYLLRAHPISHLFPLPAAITESPLQALLSLGSIASKQDPITPLGQDAIHLLLRGLTDSLGWPARSAQPLVSTAGERLWLNISGLARHPFGRRIIHPLFTSILPEAEQNLAETLLSERSMRPVLKDINIAKTGRVLRLAIRILSKIVRCWRQPEFCAEETWVEIDRHITALKKRSSIRGNIYEKLHYRIARLFELYQTLPFALPQFLPVILGGLIPAAILYRLAAGLQRSQNNEPEPSELVHLILSGLPNDIDAEMEQGLWEISQQIDRFPDTCSEFKETAMDTLTGEHRAGRLPQFIHTAIACYDERYGAYSTGEIDIGCDHWNLEPERIFQDLKRHLQNQDESLTPKAAAHRSAQNASLAAGQLEAALSHTRGGRFKTALARWCIHRARALGGLRRSLIFYLSSIASILRQGLLKSGQDFTKAGLLAKPDDIFFLSLAELEALANRQKKDWKELVASRRRLYEGEKFRPHIPRLLFSDGRALFDRLPNNIVGG